jgi:hypothetical protein
MGQSRSDGAEIQIRDTAESRLTSDITLGPKSATTGYNVVIFDHLVGVQISSGRSLGYATKGASAP